MKIGRVGIAASIAIVITALSACGNTLSRSEVQKDFASDLHTIGYTSFELEWSDESKDRPRSRTTSPKRRSSSKSKGSAKRSTPELEAFVTIAGCRVTIERERAEDRVMRKIGDRDIEYFEVEVGGVDVEDDTLSQSPTKAELEKFLKKDASRYSCVI